MKKNTTEAWYSVKAWLCSAKKPIFVLAACILTAMIPLLLANFNYLDDLGRVAIGYRQWSDYSRYVSEYGSVLLHAGTYLTDISPLPQMIAAVFMAVAGVAAICCLKKEDVPSISVLDIAAVLPLALSPYFLECLSYKYDAPYMAFSVLASILPVLVYRYRGTGRLFCLASVLGMLLMCLSYQASSGIYPMLIVFTAFSLWNRGEVKEALRLAGQAVLCYLAGLLIFRFACMPDVDSYVSTSILPLPQLIPGFFAQLIRYVQLILADFKKIWLLLIAILSLLFVAVSVRDSKQNRILAFFVSAGVLALAFALAFGVYPALAIALEEPRAMFGFGAWIAFVAVSAAGAKKANVVRLCALALSWCFFTFTLTYGNALIEQKCFAESRIQLVLQDLNDLKQMNDGNFRVVSVSGDIGHAPVVAKIPGSRHILSRLIPTLFSGNDWGENYIYCYYGIKNIAMLEDGSYLLDKVDITKLDLPVLKDTMFHTIRGDSQCLVIDLK